LRRGVVISSFSESEEHCFLLQGGKREDPLRGVLKKGDNILVLVDTSAVASYKYERKEKRGKGHHFLSSVRWKILPRNRILLTGCGRTRKGRTTRHL